MKRVVVVLIVLGLIGAMAFLGVTRNMAQQRAAKLDKALNEAEGKIMELEGEIQALQEDIEKLKEKQTSPAPAAGQSQTQPSSPTSGSSPSPVPGTATNAAASASGAAPAPAAGASVRYSTAGGPGITNMVRIEGTSSVHDWRVVGSLIGGTVEFPQGFPAAPSGEGKTGPIPAKAGVFVPARSMKSILADGKPYSDAMDEIMYGKLLVQQHPRITFTLNSLESKAGEGAGTYQASGELGLAGKTNAVNFPVTITSLSEGRAQVSGSFKTKMTDFGIEPPAPGPIRTGDEVTLRFVWSLKPAASSGTR